MSSSAGIETSVVAQWLVGRLSGDAALAAIIGDRVWDNDAPQDSDEPYVVFSYAGGSDLVTVGAGRVYHSARYSIKVVAQADSRDEVEAAANRMDELLHPAGPNLPIAGGELVSCIREDIIDYTESEEGRRYKHLGGTYRLKVRTP